MVTTPTDAELLEDIRSGPMGQKMLREREERWLAERKRGVAEIKKITAAHEKAFPGLQAALDEATERVERAKEAVKEAEEAYRITWIARSNATVRSDSKRGRLEAQLLQTAPAEIDAFIAEIYDEGEQVRQRGITAIPARRNRLTRQMEGGSSNAESVNAYLKAINAARLQAEELKLRALDHDELAAELDKIRREIPAVKA